MRAALWSPTGGSGVTALSCALALRLSETGPCTLLDAAGDVQVALGVALDTSLGLTDWLVAGAGRTADSLLRIAEPVTKSLAVVSLGATQASFDASTAIDLTAMESAVIDLGRNAVVPVNGAVKLLVIKKCYLAVRRAQNLVQHCDALVVVQEDGRRLSKNDLSEILGKPIAGTVSWDKAVARAVDIGVLQANVPKRLREELDRIVEWST